MNQLITKSKPFLLTAFVLAGFMYFALNMFSYFSPFPWCRIQIHANLAGNRGTIKEALKLLRQSDKIAYYILCANVDVIYEKYCIDRDWNLSPQNYIRKDAPGCYIKGSHSVYLTPSRDSSTTQIKLRAITLKKLSEYSRDFWLHH